MELIEGGMRRYRLNRLTDPTGVSGTGIVAEGVVFSDGHAVTHWLTEVHSTVCWDTHSVDEAVAAIERIHGHGGYTTIEWTDGDGQA
jgi:hypothetical protein